MEQVLYDLPDGWEWPAIGDLVFMHYGKALKSSDRQSGNIPVYGSNGIVGNHDIALWEKPTIIIGRKGSVGEVNLCAGPSWTIDTAYFVEIMNTDKLLLQFLYYYAKTVDISTISQKGVKPGVNRNDYLNLRFPLPSLVEQQRLVAKLDALLSRIDKAIELLRECLNLANVLMEHNLKQVFSQPSNKEVIKNIFEVHNGRAYNRPELLDSGKYKVLRIQNIKGGSNFYYSDLELDENKYCLDGDLLFSWSGTPGTSFGAFVWNGEKSIYHYHIWKMEPKIKINDRYAYWMLKNLTEDAIANARGVAGMLHITKGMMESFTVSLPTLDRQEKIAHKLDRMDASSKKYRQVLTNNINNLLLLKASILDAAFKGQL